MLLAQLNKGFPWSKKIDKFSVDNIGWNHTLQIMGEYAFYGLGYFFQMTIQIDLLEAASHRIIDGIQANVTIR